MEWLRYFAAILSFSVCVNAIVGPVSNITKTSMKTDTYLDAYSKSRIEAEKAKQGVVIITAKDGEKKISNRDDSYHSGYDYPAPFTGDNSYSSSGSSSFSGPTGSSGPSYSPVKFESDITYNAPANTYGPPSASYGPPAQSYGPPAQSYGPPAQSYGPPAPIYGAPAQAFGPPVHKPLAPVYGPSLKPVYNVPYTAPSFGFFDKLALKLDILTIAKLLLKFLIFKKLVTMLAVVCMLLVIPKLITFKKDGGSNNDEEERAFGKKNRVELTSVQQLVERAITVYEQQQPDCGFTCRVRRVVDDIYDFQPYFRADASRTTIKS